MEEPVETQSEELFKHQVENISSVSEDSNGTLFVSTSDGFIYEASENSLNKVADTGGQPFSILHDSTDVLFITDLAHQTIYSYTEEDSLQEIVEPNEGVPFLGPNSVACNENSNLLYFTDSGPMGDTSLFNPKGSVFVRDDQGKVKPILLNCLAHPAGIALAPDGKSLYVAETFRNRVLKIVNGPNGNYYSSVLFQFSGRVGPTALCVAETGWIFVAHYEFVGLCAKGKISVLNAGGILVKSFVSPVVAPDSMCFSKLRSNVMFLTGNGKCFRVVLPGIEPKVAISNK